MRSILIVTPTTGYQTRSFGEAAARLGVSLVFGTDRCHQIDDPWRDAAVPIRFHDERASVRAILDASAVRPFDGVLALGDRPTAIAARVSSALGLPGHPLEAVAISRDKLAMRRCLAAAGMAVPWFREVPLDADPREVAADVSFPCVLKPRALSGSRGVIRADDTASFVEAFERLRRLLSDKSVRSMRDPVNETVIVEGFIAGREFAVEGLIEAGQVRTLAVFDKPDPLDGPFFEETIYVTPSSLPGAGEHALRKAVGQAIAAIGLRHGPVHAECRMDNDSVVVLEVAARPIGGLCARALRFEARDGTLIPFEELLLRHALGDSTEHLPRESSASAVMMIPIPGRGVYRRVEGVEGAAGVPGIDEVRITAKPDQVLVPLPEGASYLGFIFARRDAPGDAVEAVRVAHARLRFVIEKEIPVEKGSGVFF